MQSGDPLNELKDLLDHFYNDEQINNVKTMVNGNDLCEILGLFHDLGEAIHAFNVKRIAELEKYKQAY